MNAVVVSLGGLHAGLLGCYGGASIETPALDRLAANGFVFDQCIVERPCPITTRRNWWSGQRQYRSSAASTTAQDPAHHQVSGEGESLVAALRRGGWHTVLVRDTGTLVDRSSAPVSDFETILEIERREQDTTDAVFETAKQWLSSHSASPLAKSPFLLFIDCYGAHPPWLGVPDEIEFAEGDVDSGPEPDDSVELDDEFDDAADLEGPSEADSDEAAPSETSPILPIACHLDLQLGEFLDWLETTPAWRETMMLVTSDFGIPAGRGGHSESQASAPMELTEGHTHVPLVMRLPRMESGGRSAAIVQPIDVLATVIDALGCNLAAPIDGASLLPICRFEQRSVRDYALLNTPGAARAVRTLHWFLLQSAGDSERGGPEPRLFVKPEDRWDHDDVSKQYPEVVADLQKILE
jgi:hypothetical protein